MDGSDIYEKLVLQFFSIKRELNLKCKKSYLLKISILLLYWAQVSEMRDNNQLQFVMQICTLIFLEEGYCMTYAALSLSFGVWVLCIL